MTNPYAAPPAPMVQPRPPVAKTPWGWIVFGFVGIAILSTIAVVVLAQLPQRQQSGGIQQATAATGPLTEVSDGTYLVGDDMAAGSYKSTKMGYTGTCSWFRLTDTTGAAGTIKGWDVTRGLAQVTVTAGEYLKVTGCTLTKNP